MSWEDDRLKRVVACLEALYAWERDDEHWLRATLRAVSGLWDAGVWTSGIMYDASHADRFTVHRLAFDDKASDAVRGLVVDIFRGFPPSFVSSTYRALTIGFGRPVGPELEPFYRALEHHGTVDIFGINGLDPSGVGCCITIGAPPNANMSADDLLTFQRISSHLASAYRCRQRLRSATIPAMEQAEAIARPDGTIVDAKGPAEPRAVRRALSAQIATIEKVRALGSREPAVQWMPRLQGRWTVVDSPKSETERYVLARENLCAVPALARLTERELQVVAMLSLGRSTKEAAYDLGITDSTVRVLVTRAYERLNVKSRSELMELPEVRALREGRASLEGALEDTDSPT